MKVRATKLLVLLALLLPVSACATDLPQDQVVLTEEQVIQQIKSELVMRYGQVIYVAPYKNNKGKEMDRSAFYHVRVNTNIDANIELGIYICTVGVGNNQTYYTDCSITNGQ